MVGKRKIDSLRANIAKMAKAAEADNGQEFQQACKEIPNLLDLDQKDPDRLLADGLSSQEYFSKILESATKMDRILEYLLFKRDLPKLLPEEKIRLDLLVRKELMVDEALASMR